jgi:hypothetical protein
LQGHLFLHRPLPVRAGHRSGSFQADDALTQQVQELLRATFDGCRLVRDGDYSYWLVF